MALTTVQVGMGGNSNAPIFSAYASSSTSLTANTATLIGFQTKVWDTATCYNNTGSTVTLNGLSVPAYAFCPNVAGYYQVTAMTSFGGTITGTTFVTLFKNNSRLQDGNYTIGAESLVQYNLNYLIYLNGTGDYIQFYCYETSTSPSYSGGSNGTYFQACLVRSA